MSRSYLDFKAIRERVPFLGVLDRYHVEVKRVNTSQLKGRCPLPSHTSKEPDTFCVNTEKNVFCCHSDSCKKSGHGASGNVIDFVCLMESIQAYEAAAKLNEWYPDGLPPKPATAAEPEENRPLAFTLKDVNPEHPMIQSRGITALTAKKFGVGFFPGKGSMAGRIVFPLHESGRLVGYAGRATGSGQEPKWLLGKGLKKSFLFGLERCDPAKPLVLVESPWAVLRYNRYRPRWQNRNSGEYRSLEVSAWRALREPDLPFSADQASEPDIVLSCVSRSGRFSGRGAEL